METLLGNPILQRVAASLGVAGSVALAFFYVLVPALSVPVPATYGFYAAWVALVVLSLRWWGGHPWRAFAVPVVGLVAVLVALWFGGEYLGWAP